MRGRAYPRRSGGSGGRRRGESSAGSARAHLGPRTAVRSRAVRSRFVHPDARGAVGAGQGPQRTGAVLRPSRGRRSHPLSAGVRLSVGRATRVRRPPTSTSSLGCPSGSTRSPWARFRWTVSGPCRCTTRKDTSSPTISARTASTASPASPMRTARSPSASAATLRRPSPAIYGRWNDLVRLYRPRPEVLDGTWSFPTISGR